MKLVALKPRLSEKTYSLSQSGNTFVFEIPDGVNKHLVAQTVTEQFKVTVTDVRIANMPGKSRRVYRKRGRNGQQSTSSGYRKAFVTLKEGDKLPIFADASNEETKQPAKEKK